MAKLVKNKKPVASTDYASVTEDSLLEVEGNVLANDIDPDGGPLSLSVARPGTFVGTYGTLTLYADGSYTYVLNNSLLPVQALGGGRTKMDSFTYEASDGASSTKETLRVTIVGINDDAIITSAPGGDVGTVVEDGVLTAAGALSFTDVDKLDLHTLSVMVPAPGTLGSMIAVLTSDTNANGVGGIINWVYNVDNSAIQYLEAGETKVETFTIALSDGTSTVTKEVSVTIAGVDPPQALVAFRASVGGNIGLWVWDGTAATQIDPNPAGSSYPAYLTNVDGVLYFQANDGTDYGLWSYDGATLAEIDLGVAGSSSPAHLTNVDGVLYFSAYDGSHVELWSYDGITATQIDLNLTGSSSPYNLTSVGGVLYFVANDGAGTELWSYDGSEATKIDLNPEGSSSPAYLTNVDGVLYFSAYDGTGYELWSYDGNALTKIGLNPTVPSEPRNLTNVDGVLYFSAYDGAGRDVWYYNGSTATKIEVNPLGLAFDAALFTSLV